MRRTADCGWIDFRRLRADARWALFRVQVFDSAKPENAPTSVAIDPETPAPDDPPMLLREFCSKSLPPINAVVELNRDVVYELGPSSVGNSKAFSCFFASRIPRIASRWADEQNDRGEYAATISVPVESLQFDLLVHRDCEFALNARTQVYGILDLTPENRNDRDLIPLELTRTDLGRFPPVVDTPLVARYSQLVDDVMKESGWNRKDFIGVRFTLSYPPFPSTVIVRFPLAERAARA